MNGQDISAFSVYSSRKKSKELKTKKKLKQKLKKKKKLQQNNVNSVINSLIQVMESSPQNIAQGKNEKKDLIKAILKKKEESIFKDCTLTTKVDNVFFNGNSSSDKCTSGEKFKTSLCFSNKAKKLQNKKAINGVNLSSEKIEQNNLENSTPIKSGVELNNVNSLKKKNESFNKSTKKNKFKNLVTDNNGSSNIIYSDSVKLGEELLLWLLSPLSVKKFFETCWEQKPLHIQHNNEYYFKCICTLEDFKAALRDHEMYFTKNIDITSYINGERATENLEGKAKPSVVWDFFKNGRSIRLLNPQAFITNIQVLNSTLQEFFQCFVGANIYLTPPGAQGFAPHYDDIEAFVLQLEGEKHWKLYNPRSPEEVLPRASSRNFKENEIGEPILEVTLKPGDLLYFPRGIIHQAKCLPHIHSLHITVSCYQKNSWADLLEKVLPVALQSAINEDVDFRKGLPVGYLNSLGLVYSDHESSQQQKLKNKFKELFGKILEYCPLDAAVDQLGASFAYDALPPWITEVEKIHGADRSCRVDGVWDALLKYKDKNLSVKLIRATSVRLVSEQEEMLLYYTTDNSLVYHEHENYSVKVSNQWAQAIDCLIRSYPKFVQMKELPVSNNVNKPGKWKRIVECVYFLWQKGLLLFDQPLLQLCT